MVNAWMIREEKRVKAIHSGRSDMKEFDMMTIISVFTSIPNYHSKKGPIQNS